MSLTFDEFTALIGNRILKLLASITSPDSLTQNLGILMVLGIEIFALGYARSSLYRLLRPTPSTRIDLFYFGGRVLGYSSLLAGIASLGLPSLSTRLANAYAGVNLLGYIQNSSLRFVVFLVLTDFVAYWTHRARHQWGWLWELHKLHHSAEEFNAITTSRGHPLETAIVVVMNCVPMALLGASINEFLFLSLLLGLHAGLTHSMLDWRWGWFGKYVLFSPVGHRIHHSYLPEHHDKNFGALFPVWDRLFGTLYLGETVNEKVGVTDNYYNKGIVADFVEGFRRMASRVFSRSASGSSFHPMVNRR